MAYKQISPRPIGEGGTNTISMINTDGVCYYDGTKINTTSVGTATFVLTGNTSAAPTFQAAPSSGNTFSFSTGNAGNSAGNQFQLSKSAGTFYSAPFAEDGSATQSIMQMVCPLSGTISQLYVKPFTNSSSQPTVVTLNINGSTTALTVTVPAGSTSVVSDLVDTVSVSAGALIQWQAVSSGTGFIYGCISSQFTT